MVKINLIRGQQRAGIFYRGKQQWMFSFFAVAFLIVSLSLYTFFYWKLDYAQSEFEGLSKQIIALDIANKKVIASKEANVKRKIDAFLEQARIQEAVGTVTTTRKIFFLVPKELIQVDRFSFANKEITMSGTASDFSVITGYLKKLKNNIAPYRNWRLVSTKQREIKGRKVYEFLIKCERGERLL